MFLGSLYPEARFYLLLYFCHHLRKRYVICLLLNYLKAKMHIKPNLLFVSSFIMYTQQQVEFPAYSNKSFWWILFTWESWRKNGFTDKMKTSVLKAMPIFPPFFSAGMLCLITLIHKTEKDEIIKKRSEDWELQKDKPFLHTQVDMQDINCDWQKWHINFYLKSPEVQIIENSQFIKNKTTNKENRVQQRNGSEVNSKWREKREICQPPNLNQDHK